LSGFSALADEKAVLKTTRDREAKAAAKAPKEPAAAAPVAEKAASVSAPAPKAPAKAKAVAKPAEKKAEASQAKPSLEDKNRPVGIARPTAVDDLKLISGVGPKNEKILHELGIFTFAQVASWKKAERDWVDGYLNFHGRVEREDWVKQAKALAKGGVAEYIRVFGKKPV
jgi:NADH-quinone oxidoreductase subunit E